MHTPNYYQSLTPEEILTHIRQEGFNPLKIHNNAGYLYPSHSHPETKLLAILEGSMILTVNKKKYNCNKYDKIVIPGNITHSAVVGPEGCIFFWAEKIINT